MDFRPLAQSVKGTVLFGCVNLGLEIEGRSDSEEKGELDTEHAETRGKCTRIHKEAQNKTRQ